MRVRVRLGDTWVRVKAAHCRLRVLLLLRCDLLVDAAGHLVERHHVACAHPVRPVRVVPHDQVLVLARVFCWVRAHPAEEEVLGGVGVPSPGALVPHERAGRHGSCRNGRVRAGGSGR